MTIPHNLDECGPRFVGESYGTRRRPLARIKVSGENAIDQMLSDRQSEELWLDFKRAATDASSTKLHGDDRRNLARAISGFANSEGGVVIWGVDCSNESESGDIAKAKHPVEEPLRFKSWLENAVSGCALRPHAEYFVEPHKITRPPTHPGVIFAAEVMPTLRERHTVSEIARLLGMSRATLHRLMAGR